MNRKVKIYMRRHLIQRKAGKEKKGNKEGLGKIEKNRTVIGLNSPIFNILTCVIVHTPNKNRASKIKKTDKSRCDLLKKNTLKVMTKTCKRWNRDPMHTISKIKSEWLYQRERKQTSEEELVTEIEILWRQKLIHQKYNNPKCVIHSK